MAPYGPHLSRSNDPQEGINMAEHSTGMMYGEYLQVNNETVD